jgi:hypothetical protein
MNRFWNGGNRTYGAALRQQFSADRDELTARLAAAQTDGERRELQEQIARLTDTYREKSRAVGRGLF